MKSITKAQYRAMDLTIFAVLVCVFEAIIVIAIRQWFPSALYTVSLLVPFIAIIAMRWGAYAFIHVILASLAFCIASGADGTQYIIYCVGSCLMMLPVLLMFKLIGKEKIRQKWYMSILYTVAIFVFVQLGRAVLAAILTEKGFFESLSTFFFTDVLSMVFGVVIVIIARRQDGMFEDQNLYIKRINEEKKKQESEN